MAVAVGGLLAFAVGVFARLSGLDRDRAFYPTVAIVVASYYCLFAVMGGSTRALAVETMAAVAFVAAAAAFLAWLLASGRVRAGLAALPDRP